MRWLSRLLIVVIVCFVAIPLLTPTAGADVGGYITLSPSQKVPGEDVTVRGYNFTAREWVDIYYDVDGDEAWGEDEWVEEIKTDGDGHFEVPFTVPESYRGDHTVRAVEDASGKYGEAILKVKPGLTVDPEEGPVGTNVTVEGHGFAEDEEGIDLRYYLNGSHEPVVENIEADEDGSWQRTFPIPPSSKGDHKIDAEGDDSDFGDVMDAFFEVTPGLSLGKSSGTVGENITMTGSGFAVGERDIAILFDGEAVTTEIRASDAGYWQEMFTVPEMAKGTYSVTAEGERTEDISELSFEVEPGLVLPPGEGHVGMNLTVIGQGFAANEDVVIHYDGSQKATAITNNRGSFQAVSPVPESQHGQRLVTAEDAAGNDATAVFTMESARPDAPDLISPPDGSRVGFIGKVRPAFEWSEVQDDSGVRYGLQISTSADASITGGFADPVVSEEGLIGTNYTLDRTEALPYGTYYWIVQAVDRAGNKSNWTEPIPLRVGLLPLWAFILIIVAVVALIGALVYFFIIRRRVHYY